MKLVQYRTIDSTLHAGLWEDGVIYALDPGQTLSAILAGASVTRGQPVAQARLATPFTPSQILCIGKNYADHAAEMKGDVPEFPLVFVKLPGSVIGPNESVQWRRSLTSQVDWEGELGVVIGQTAKNIPAEQAYDHIFGYVIANDITARDLQKRDGQWARAKGMDTFCPLGPFLVTRDEIADPHDLMLSTYVDEERVQHASTGLLMRRIPELVAYLSQTFTLTPGTLILTGTPAGVGAGMTPPRFLEDGMRLRVEIAGLGALENVCAVAD